ncbi:MAG TPA: hypothetical protein VJO34_02005 [Methylomirabilota bacterium]|nr:hypothetical protein [Methylomirabilota bacterium]
MMTVKWGVALAIGTLVVGLLVGYLMWGQSGQKLGELNDLKTRLTQEAQRAADAESKLADMDARLKQFGEDLEAERKQRQRLQELLGQGRK